MATKILFVCLGNICRSPTAEVLFAKVLAEAGRSHDFEIDSAGTGGWHSGQRADARTRATALRRGVDITHLARQISAEDYDHYDLIIAMDKTNYAMMKAAAPHAADKVHLFGEFADLPLRAFADAADVPDPYYGEAAGFDEVYDMCEQCARGLLRYLDETAR